MGKQRIEKSQKDAKKAKTVKVKRARFKGKFPTVMISEEILISMFEKGMAPQKALEIVKNIVDRFDTRRKKTLLKTFGLGYGNTAETKKRLKKLERLEKLLR